MVPSIYLTNRNPRVYEQPEQFRPERFLESAPETFSWIPFGGGIRRCIGASFAQLEMKLILRTMLGELEPSLPGHGARWRGRRVEPPAGDHAGPGGGRAGGVAAQERAAEDDEGRLGRPGVRSRLRPDACTRRPGRSDPGRGGG